VDWTKKECGVGDVNINALAELYRLVLNGLLTNTIQSGKEGGYGTIEAQLSTGGSKWRKKLEKSCTSLD